MRRPTASRSAPMDSLLSPARTTIRLPSSTASAACSAGWSTRRSTESTWRDSHTPKTPAFTPAPKWTMISGRYNTTWSECACSLWPDHILKWRNLINFVTLFRLRRSICLDPIAGTFPCTTTNSWGISRATRNESSVWKCLPRMTRSCLVVPTTRSDCGISVVLHVLASCTCRQVKWVRLKLGWAGGSGKLYMIF